MSGRILFVMAVFFFCKPAFSQVQPLVPFKKGDRIAFVGNSITEAGYYESYIWLYYMLHYPERRLTVFNVGIGGDRAKNIVDRWDDDVLGKRPTTICLTFGMNDSGYYEFLQANADSSARARVKETEQYFELLRTKLKAYPAAQKVVMTSSPYDETMKNPKNYFPKKSQTMEAIAAFQQKAATEEHWGLVDFFHPMTAIDLREQKKDSTFTLTGPDRIHPGNAGHFVMAYLFLKQQGLAGKPVAGIGIDVINKKVSEATNCVISGLAITPGEVQFDYLAGALPFPMDTIARLSGNPQKQSEALGLVPFNEELNQELLTIKGLGEKVFALSIDGKIIGNWTGKELGKGINLATLTSTPEYEQAMAVLWLNEERMAIESKLRAYYWLQFDFFKDIGLQYADNAAAVDSVNDNAGKNWAVAFKKDNYRAARYAIVREGWQKEMEALVDEIYRVNKPGKHVIRVKGL